MLSLNGKLATDFSCELVSICWLVFFVAAANLYLQKAHSFMFPVNSAKKPGVCRVSGRGKADLDKIRVALFALISVPAARVILLYLQSLEVVEVEEEEGEAIDIEGVVADFDGHVLPCSECRLVLHGVGLLVISSIGCQSLVHVMCQ